MLQELKLPCLAHVLEDPEVFLFLGVLEGWEFVKDARQISGIWWKIDDSKLKINKNAIEMEYDMKQNKLNIISIKLLEFFMVQVFWQDGSEPHETFAAFQGLSCLAHWRS